jgi:hypothetical protein
MLCELPEINVIDICINCSDDVPIVGFLARLEVSLPIFQEADVAVGHPTDQTLASVGAPSPESVAVGCSPIASMEVHVGSPLLWNDDIAVVSANPSVEPAQDDLVTLEISDVDTTIVTLTEIVAVEDATTGQTPKGAILVTKPSADVGIPMGITLQLGALESSALLPTALVASASVTSSERVSPALTLPLPTFLANLHVVVL